MAKALPMSDKSFKGLVQSLTYWSKRFGQYNNHRVMNAAEAKKCKERIQRVREALLGRFNSHPH
jgi:hypothetical protein